MKPTYPGDDAIYDVPASFMIDQGWVPFEVEDLIKDAQGRIWYIRDITVTVSMPSRGVAISLSGQAPQLDLEVDDIYYELTLQHDPLGETRPGSSYRAKAEEKENNTRYQKVDYSGEFIEPDNAENLPERERQWRLGRKARERAAQLRREEAERQKKREENAAKSAQNFGAALDMFWSDDDE